MKLSTKVRYGLRAILQISIEGEEKPLMARRIARKQQVSEPYIDQLLIPLRTSGLIRSFRGRSGGYQLAVDPQSLTVLQIVEALDGKLTIIDCLDKNNCDRQPTCVTRIVWERANRALRQCLESMTLEDLRKLEQKFERPPDFVI